MAPQIYIIFAILLAVCLPGYDCDVVASNDSPSLRSNSTNRNGANFYYVTSGSAGWTTLQRDCRDIFGEGAKLIEVESPSKLATLTELMQGSNDFGVSYYTGGYYSSEERKFLWIDSNIAIDDSWFPWYPGHPKNRNDFARIIAVGVEQAGVKFKTVLKTQSFRGICEYVEE